MVRGGNGRPAHGDHRADEGGHGAAAQGQGHPDDRLLRAGRPPARHRRHLPRAQLTPPEHVAFRVVQLPGLGRRRPGQAEGQDGQQQAPVLGRWIGVSLLSVHGEVIV